ncbi:MAG: 3-deoxy-7-phosphoheptulonate synthase [Deltaproteobacteria bacterium]|nr:3-deoxy-7-phosphoheptulonate synthase [Deltaproteobacteria bacterium]MBW2067726.1 3-deoxy-7-phosphoheptulonate synthase [Deltaproteobacteria bacterium]
MIIVMTPDHSPEDLNRVIRRIEDLGLKAHISKGEHRTIVGAIGDERVLREIPIESMSGVEKVMPIMSPYKLVSREFKSEDTIIKCNGYSIGNKKIQVIAGPCAVESREMLEEVAKAIRPLGVNFLRGGAFKPRTSPYSFQGLGKQALEYMARVREETGMLVVTELMDPRDAVLVAKYADIIQIGTRNMQNFRLLTEVGNIEKPVLLKRGMSATIKEWLMSAEYIASQGNENIILCERGIRTFETETRNTLDLSAVPVLKRLTHLPVIVDPSHAVGRVDLVPAMAKAAIAAGADGLLIEVHPRPEEALSDGPQSLTPQQFAKLMEELKWVAEAVGREL